MKWWDQMPWSLFSECWALSQFFHSPLFTFIKRLFSSSSLSAISMVSSAYLRLLIFLLAILIPACAFSSPAFLMMYSACKLNKQSDNIQPWRTPFAFWNLYFCLNILNLYSEQPCQAQLIMSHLPFLEAIFVLKNILLWFFATGFINTTYEYTYNTTYEYTIPLKKKNSEVTR